MSKQKVSAKHAKKVTFAIITANISFNNTIITVADSCGNVLFSFSSGMLGFKGSKKSSAFAGIKVMEKILERLPNHQIKILEIYFKGPGSQKEAILKSALTSGFKITKIGDKTTIPHNGVRPPKKRRA
ncbi:MAG: 30S ribosomal protein S11 [Rickettsiales bacterium]